MEKGTKEVVDEPKKQLSSKSKTDALPIAQSFLKIISAQIDVKEDEAKFVNKIQNSDLVVQVKYSLAYKTKPAAGSLIPQWHAGFNFAVFDPNTQIKVKLISTKRLINTTLGKISIPINTMYEAPNLAEMPLESIHKKLKGVKLYMILMCIRDDALELAKRYSVISNLGKFKRFKHLNSAYYTQKGIIAMHPSFKIVLERPNYFPGEVVRGAVIYDRSNTVEHISHIKISATGTESSIWTEGSGSNSVTYSDSRKKFDLSKYVLCAPNKDGVPIFAGMHVYPFEVQLPSTLPSSVGNQGANMIYLISAEVRSVKTPQANKFASAFFNVYGTETKFQPPLVIKDPPAHIKKRLKDDWTGEVTLSSQLQYPHQRYAMTIKLLNAKQVSHVKVSIKYVKILRVKSSFERSNFDLSMPVLKETIPLKETTEEHIDFNYQYTLPIVPPTVAPIDDIQLFEHHTFAKITLIFADLTKRHRMVSITVGRLIPSEFANRPHVINPDVSDATLTVYEAKRPMVHGLVAYKSTSIQFFDEKIFSSYNPADLVRFENLVVGPSTGVDGTNNNNAPVKTIDTGVEEDRPVRNKYVDIDEDELPDSDESKSM